MLEYNTGRNHLVIKEYGRNIQKLIEQAIQIEDIEKRTETAKFIIKVMSQINPEVKEDREKKNQQVHSSDYWRKLWDHLFIISNYQLEVNSPFPSPTPEKIEKQAVNHQYRKGKITYRTYGWNMEQIIKAVSAYPPEHRDAMGAILANHLKKLYLIHNRNSVKDETIIAHLKELSDDAISLSEDFSLDQTRDILKENYSTLPKTNGNKLIKKSKKKKKKIR